MPPDQTIPTTADRLRHLAIIVRRRWPLLLLITTVTAASAMLLMASRSKQYDATAKLLLGDEDVVGIATGLVPNRAADPERDINTKLKLIRIETVARRVADRLGGGLSAADLDGAVTASVDGTSNLVDITATDASPRRAATIANAFADEYVAFNIAIARATLARAARSVRDQLRVVAARDPNSAQAISLRARLRDLSIASASESGGAQVVLTASPPLSPSSPSTAVVGVLGGLVGLLFAFAVVAVLEITDRRVRDEDAAEAAAALPLLARIPRPARRPRARNPLDPDELLDEGYVELAGRVLTAARKGGARLLLVTSAGSGDGKTSVTLGLARALAQVGERVVVVQTDMPVPKASGGSSEPLGLVDVVAGRARLADALVAVDIETLRPRADAAEDVAGSISVLPAGDTPPPASQRRAQAGTGRMSRRVRDCLWRPETREMLRQCAADADFVLVDGPASPVLHAAPAVIDAVETSILVCRLNWTSAESLTHARRTLDALGMPLAGLVVTGAERRTLRVPGSHSGTQAGAVVELASSDAPSVSSVGRELRR